MFNHERDSAIANVLTTILTIIGTAAALAYYISISQYNSALNLFLFINGYGILLGCIYYYLKGRYEYVSEE